jgi:hypothetical protein
MRKVFESEAFLRMSDGVCITAFDFDESSEFGEVIESDLAWAKTPQCPFLFNDEDFFIFESDEHFLGGVGVGDLKLDFAAFFQLVLLLWSLEGDEGVFSGLGGLSSKAKGLVGVFEGAGGVVEIGVGLVLDFNEGGAEGF